MEAIHTATILLAAVDPSTRSNIQAALEQAAYRILTADNVSSCLKQFEQHRPSLVLIDVDFNGGNLAELCDRLNQMPGEQKPTLLAIVPHDDDAVTRAFDAGVDDCITRPITPELLRRRVGMVMQVVEGAREIIKTNADLQMQIAGRERVEIELAKERNLLRTLIDNLPDEVYLRDLDGQIVLANKASIRRLGPGTPDGKVVGTTCDDYPNRYLTPEEVEHIHQRDQELIESGGGSHRTEFAIHDEQLGKRWLESNRFPLYDSQGDPVGLIVINHDITEQRRAEERLEHIITGAYCLLWYAIVEDDGSGDLHWDIYLSNEQAAHSFLPLKREPDQAYLSARWRSIPREDREQIAELSNKAIRSNQQAYNYEFRCRRVDGQVRWLREDVQIKSLTPGRYNLVGVCTDITERKEAETLLQRTNELLEEYVTERTIELSRTNEDLKEQIAERRRAEQAEREQRMMAEALGDAAAALSETLELDEVLDRILSYVARVIPPHQTAGVMLIEDEIYVRSIRLRKYTDSGILTVAPQTHFYLHSMPTLRRMYETGRPLAIPDTDASEEWLDIPETRWVRSYIGVPIHAKGGVIGFINLASDTPGQFADGHANRLVPFSNQAGIAIQNAQLFEAVRLHANELQLAVAERTSELEHERAQLHAILDAMTEGVIYYNNDGHASYINQSLSRLTGYTAEEWIESGGKWPNLAGRDTNIYQMTSDAQEVVRRHGIWHGETKMTRKDGAVFDAKLVTTLVTGPDGQPAGAVTVIHDVSAEKRLEAQKTRFIATASHELRTPIANLKTRLYLIEKQPEKLNYHLEVMSAVTDRMRKLVDDLLDVSRFEYGIISLNRQNMVLQEIVDAVIQVQQPEAASKGIVLAYDSPEAPLYVWIDQSRMTQVLTNLLTNAINYTPDGGKVHVEITLHSAVTNNDLSESYALIKIQDTGIGIPADVLPDVFKPFFRVNDYHDGVGLGLSIAKEIIELHGGDINVESQVDQGTCFTVSLPLVETGSPE